jgi:hypothetical protein
MADGVESQASGGTGITKAEELRVFSLSDAEHATLQMMRRTAARRLRTTVLAHYRGRELGRFSDLESAREAYNTAEREWEWAEEKKIDAMMHL